MRGGAFAVTVPADARYLKVIRGFFLPVMEDLFGTDSNLIILALDESCSNIIKHRSGVLDNGLIHVRVEVQSGSLRIRIGDFCGQNDVPNIKPRDLEDIRPGGLGTHFITQIMDRVEFEPEPGAPGRLALVMEKSIPKGEEKHGSEA